MYGLVMQNFTGYLIHKYGADAWDNIRRLANIDNATFTVHQVFAYIRHTFWSSFNIPKRFYNLYLWARGPLIKRFLVKTLD